MPACYPYSYGKDLLKIAGVSLAYDGHPVLRNVEATVRDIVRPGQVQGQIVGILGPSGVGKTQLFRIIAGLNQPTSGCVWVNTGKDMEIVHFGLVGVVAQSYPMFPRRSVLSNLLVSARQKEPNSKVAHDKVLELLAEFGLLDKAGLYPGQLSGGQLQRCAILQQILCAEHFLLMDEPFSGLDIVMEDKALQFILQVANRDELNTIIVVTHDITAAASICDHIWMLGRDRKPDGSIVPGAYIKQEYDLIERGLCWDRWQSNAMLRPAVADFIREVKEAFLQL